MREFVTGEGDVYEGQWRNNVRHGKGVVTLAMPDANMLLVAGGKPDDQRRWAEVLKLLVYQALSY